MLTLGIKSETLIKKGYSNVTVYSCNRKVKNVRERLNELLKKY